MKTTKLTKFYDIFTQKGEYYETVRISGLDEEDCQEQLDRYLSLKQDCYGLEVEEETGKGGEPDEVC